VSETAPASYLALSDADQAQALRPVALAAAAIFGLEVHRLEVVLHAYNTTYSLQTPSAERFAMRINTNSHSTPAEVVTQQQWLRAIAQESAVLVPHVLATPEGEWCARVESDALERPVLVTVASWLPGPDVVEPDLEQAIALGRTMAQLHAQARAWQLPQDAAMPVFDTPLFGDEDLLDSAPGLTSEQRAVLTRTREITEVAYRRQYAGGPPIIPLHADLHGGNLKWHEGQLAVFDFDDCGLGVPVLDLAISAYYIRGSTPGAEEAMREGYAQLAPLPEVAQDEFEALVAARQLLLANAILLSSTKEQREMAATYLPLSVERLRHWLETGHFTRQVPAAAGS
jgi:Ser/Thr protein kinase RdoA (MazF antagonist)